MMEIIETSIGLIRGNNSTLYTLRNDAGDELDILDFGITLHAWRINSINNAHHDVLLGYIDLSEYGSNEANFGCLVGRYANRIANGTFCLHGKTYHLPCNLGAHHLHGGLIGLGRKSWHLEQKNISNDYAELIFYYNSPSGEEGYPGNVDLRVAVKFSQENEIQILHHATTDEDTPINLTNHAYFNLGLDSNIKQHFLQINSQQYTETDQDLIPTGKLLPVHNTPYDFTHLRRIDWEQMDNNKSIIAGNGYDLNFVLREEEKPVRAALVYEEKNNLTLEVFTNKPGLQLYTGNWLEGVRGKEGIIYAANAGFCLEAQDFPDAPNHAQFPSTILKPGEIYQHEIRYKIKKGKD